MRGAAGLSSSAALAAIYARFVEPYWSQVVNVEMDILHLPDALVGTTIVQISDLHVGIRADANYLSEQIEVCNALSPDLIVITGDIIHEGCRRYLDRAVNLVGALRAKYGVFAALGNHDYFEYCRHAGHSHLRSAFVADEVTDALTRSRLTVLRNECRRVRIAGADLQLVGFEDLLSSYFLPEAAMRRVDPTLPTIGLSHNPDTMARLKFQPLDWVLCGHTHGGQVRIPFLGAPVLPLNATRYDAGKFIVGQRRLYVNRGLGYLMPVRFACRPEITRFTLTRRA
ncbi:MAG: metallophosphoesterase [Phycisphaerales bacterium]|nr:metallophosphoesterase [Phycisphaerales bacterium]